MSNTPIDTDQALIAFVDLVEERGPTVREYTLHLGLVSTSAAQVRLERLYELGYLDRTGLSDNGVGEARGYRLTMAGRRRMQALSSKAAS